MKRTILICAAGLLLIASAVFTFGDIARPKPSPEAGKVIFHTGLEIVPDAKVYEARLQISQQTLQRIREAAANTSEPVSDSANHGQRTENHHGRPVHVSRRVIRGRLAGALRATAQSKDRGGIGAGHCGARRRRNYRARERWPSGILLLEEPARQSDQRRVDARRTRHRDRSRRRAN